MAQPAVRLTYAQAIARGNEVEKAKMEKQKAEKVAASAVSLAANRVISEVAPFARFGGAVVASNRRADLADRIDRLPQIKEENQVEEEKQSEEAIVRVGRANEKSTWLGVYYGNSGLMGADFSMRLNVPSLIRTLQGFRAGLPANFSQMMEAYARRDGEGEDGLKKAIVLRMG